MTAEVVILNRGAVAIAADSAVTVSYSEDTGPKVYNTANKLFALSATEPVAVMVYGAGAFGSIPWETVVKAYRMQFSAAFDTVEEYAVSFISYLDSLRCHIPPEEQQSRVLGMAFWELQMLGERYERELSLNPTDNGDAIIRNIIDSRIRLFQEIGTDGGLDESVAEDQLNAVINDWNAFLHESLRTVPLNKETVARAREMLRISLQVVHDWPGSTGVVVAGFGTNQVFPALSHYLIDSVLAGEVRARDLGGVQIGSTEPATIMAFAQGDMVATFMDGIHPDYRLAIGGFIQEFIILFTSHFFEQLGTLISPARQDELMEEMERASSSIAEHVHSQFEDLERQQSQPIISIIELLPKEEMAEMAEALVNLTSLKRRVTPEMETVGGPVDVVVISKGDGLIWLKRKHYFTPELNFRYFERDRKIYSTEGRRPL